MGRLKKIVQFEKENMPEYQYKFLYHGVLPGTLFVLGGAVICAVFAIIGAVTDIMLLGIIPACLWGCGTAVLLILFAVYARKNSKRLIKDKTEEFEASYDPIDYETAKDELAKNNVIVDNNLIYIVEGEDLLYTQKQIDLEDCDIEFFCRTAAGAYYIRLEFYGKSDNEALTAVDLDRDLYTFFSHNMHLIKNAKLFRLFTEDKKEFLMLLHKYNDAKKMEAAIDKRNSQ